MTSSGANRSDTPIVSIESYKSARSHLTADSQNRLSTPTATVPTTGDAMLGNYVSYLYAAGRGVGTAKVYLNRLHGLRMQHPDLTAVTTDNLIDYLADRRTTHAAETRKGMRTTFRSFYAWTFQQGITPTDPAYPLPKISIPATVPRMAPDDLVQLALITADTQLTGMVMLARFGCLRLSELTTLRTDHRQGDMLRITGKGEKQRLVPINDQLMHSLLTLEREQGDGFYFPGRWGGSLHPQSVNKIITRKLGTNPHSLRHAGATAAYNATGDLRAVQLLLGHSSIATTQRYLHVGMDAVRRAAAGTTFTERPVWVHAGALTTAA